VNSIAPATGAQFSVLPSENSSGNWVKVVQRLPVRIDFDPGEDTSMVRAGMSVTAEIDTGHKRKLSDLF
jgi:membrane fusion protein (multidrug efflux system)